MNSSFSNYFVSKLTGPRLSVRLSVRPSVRPSLRPSLCLRDEFLSAHTDTQTDRALSIILTAEVGGKKFPAVALFMDGSIRLSDSF